MFSPLQRPVHQQLVPFAGLLDRWATAVTTQWRPPEVRTPWRVGRGTCDERGPFMLVAEIVT
jgi:hypothetical protein